MNFIKKIFTTEHKIDPLDKIINESKYNKDIKNILIKASKNTMDYKELNKLKKLRTPVVTYKDPLLNITWIVNLDKFNHPFGIGPDKNRFTSSIKQLYDITEEFNDSPHDSTAFDALLIKVTHRLI
jgi:hypothetical protein